MFNSQQLAPNEYKFNKIRSCLRATPNTISQDNTVKPVYTSNRSNYINNTYTRLNEIHSYIC